MVGKIYLIPTTLGETLPSMVIPQTVLEKTIQLRYFIVENTRTARRYLRLLDKTFPIDDSLFFELNKHTSPNELSSFLAPCMRGKDMGVISEAGVPGVADPGAEIAALAHSRGIQIIPLVGPSSIILAVMASGLNGQNFAFNGYLPIKSKERLKKIRQFESRAKTENQAQVFIETPYRNNQLIKDLLIACTPETQLCIAADITLSSEFILTQFVRDWKKNTPDLNKRPAIFIIKG